MRITKVALAFFSIGFLAGSFERAAGLGHSEVSRAAQERLVGAAVAQGTLTVMASAGSFGGLPQELFARSPLASDDRPPSVSAGLSEAMLDESWASMVQPMAYAPEIPSELIARPAVGPRASSRFGAKKALTLPDRLAMTRMPPPMSLQQAMSFDFGKGTTERDSGSVNGPEFIMPFERGRVTSLFHQGRYHPAIDLAGPLGTRVQATTRRQRVTFTGWRNGYGNTVVTRDDLGRTHLYGHLLRVATKVGVMLDQGQMLGALGSTGHSTGPHVHYELKSKAGGHIDPVTLLFGRRVGRGFAWNGARSVGTRVASRSDGQPRPR